jgi:hypothetical protein
MDISGTILILYIIIHIYVNINKGIYYFFYIKIKYFNSICIYILKIGEFYFYFIHFNTQFIFKYIINFITSYFSKIIFNLLLTVMILLNKILNSKNINFIIYIVLFRFIIREFDNYFIDEKLKYIIIKKFID